MGELIDLQARSRRLSKTAAKQHTLCREGHHKWEIVQDKQFDSRQGRLVTLYRCSRCGERKTSLL